MARVHAARRHQGGVPTLQEILRPRHLPRGRQAHPRDGPHRRPLHHRGAHRAHCRHFQHLPQSRQGDGAHAVARGQHAPERLPWRVDLLRREVQPGARRAEVGGPWTSDARRVPPRGPCPGNQFQERPLSALCGLQHLPCQGGGGKSQVRRGGPRLCHEPMGCHRLGEHPGGLQDAHGPKHHAPHSCRLPRCSRECAILQRPYTKHLRTPGSRRQHSPRRPPFLENQ